MRLHAFLFQQTGEAVNWYKRHNQVICTTTDDIYDLYDFFSLQFKLKLAQDLLIAPKISQIGN